MKLIIQADRIVGTTGEGYNGPERFITAPADFDINRMEGYLFIDGKLINPIQPDLQQVLEDQLDLYIESKARERGYGNSTISGTLSIATYVDDKNPRFKAEALIFKDWRSDMYTTGIKLVTKVLTGQLPVPASLIDILPLFPVLDWDDKDIPPLPDIDIPGVAMAP